MAAVAPVYGGKGSVISWIQFSGHDLGGTLLWLNPSHAGGLFPNGFTNRAEVVGSLAGTPRFQSGVTILSGGGLNSDITNHIEVHGRKITDRDGRKLKLSIKGTTGLFKGRMINPDTGDKMTFEGALFDGMQSGAGFFLGNGQSGGVYVGPEP